MSLRLHTPPSAPPVTLAEARLHLLIDDGMTDADSLILSLIDAATADAEHLMGRAIMPQKWQLSLSAFCNVITLQRPTVTAVDVVTYIDNAGALQTVDPVNYQIANASDYTAALVPAFGKSWPSSRCQPEAVKIVFSCGYADAASVPASIKAWIKLRIGALYVNRESFTEQQTHSLGMTDSLLDRYRVWHA